MSIIKRIKLSTLDNLELFVANNSTQTFPLHYHETFCISIIEKGAFIENDKTALPCSLLISNPFEIHKNTPFENLDYSIKTIYLTKEMFDFILPKYQKEFLLPNLINDIDLIEKLSSITKKMTDISNLVDKEFENIFFQFLSQLSSYRISFCQKQISKKPSWIEEAQEYLQLHLEEKISLEKLAEKVHLDKFQFIRQFKKSVGLTPFQYIILHRISQTKKLLEQGSSLTETALSTGFYDQSNFTHYFKSYVGVTPKNYQISCNILQE